MMRALRRGETVGLLPDQVPPEGMGVWAPFFGRPAYTMTLAARLVQQTGAAVGVVWGERLPRGARLRRARACRWPSRCRAGRAGRRDLDGRRRGHQPLRWRPLIRAVPAQYLWGYHRYKQPRRAGRGAVHA